MKFQLVAIAALFNLLCASASALVGGEGKVARLPLRFEPNRGQLDPSVQFAARCPGCDVRIAGGTVCFVLREGSTADAVQMEVVGAGESTAIGMEPLPGVSHWLRANEPIRAIQGIPGFARVLSADVRPGIDLELHGDRGQLEFDLRVAAGAPRESLALQFRGADAIERESDGALRLETSAGALRLQAPCAWQEIDGRRVGIDAAFVVDPARSDARSRRDPIVRIELGAHRSDLPLVIDPVVVRATYLGGTGFDAIQDVAVASTGEVYVTGSTSSTDFPIVNGYEPTITPFYDVFVAKLDSTLSSLVWSTYLGGTAPYTEKETGLSIVRDGGDNVYVLGTTTASDFPRQNAFQSTHGGGTDAVLFGLSAAGDTLLFSTYLGGSKEETAGTLAIDSSGQLYAIGGTASSDFPTASALQTGLKGLSDAWVASFDAAGAVRFSTYLGGAGFDAGQAIAVDFLGALLLGGSAETGFPTTAGALFDTGVGFVARMDAFGTTLVSSTMFAGAPAAIGGDSFDRVYVSGTTSALDFPTTFGAWQTEHGGSYDSHWLQIFAAAFAPDLSTQIYGTYYGSFSMNETARDMIVDDVGEITIAGTASEHTGSNTENALLLKLSPDGSALAWDFWVGSGSEYGFGLARDANGLLHLGGQSWGGLNATSGALQTSYRGSSDGFVAQVDAPASSIAHLTLHSTRVVGGDSLLGTITLDGDAPAGGIVVAISSSDPAVASVPSTVLVPAGHATTQFVVQTTAVTTPTPVTIQATWNGTSAKDLLVWLGPTWRIDFLGTLIGAESRAAGISSTGRIAGSSRGADIWFHAVRYAGGLVEDLGPGEGSDINDSGQVSSSFGTAMRFTDGVGMVDLGTLRGGSISEARGINNLGQVVGWSDGRTVQQHAFRYTDGVGMVDLGTIGGALSDAEDLNDSGQVVGSSFVTGNTAWRAFRYTDGVGMVDLGVLAGFAHSYGKAINESGQVAGTLFDASYSLPHAFRYTDGSGLLDLGTLPGESASRGEAIDSGGRVAGTSGERVFLWTDVNGMEDVTDGLLPENLFGWEMLEVAGMNDAGEIVGRGYFLGNHRQESAFQIVPIGARWSSYGAGWPGTLGIPTLLPTGDPLIGQPLTVDLTNSLGANTPGLLFLGFATASVPTRGGTLLVTPTFILPLVVPAGGLSMTDTLPNDPALADLSVFLQALELDHGAVGKLSFTAGLELVLGN